MSGDQVSFNIYSKDVYGNSRIDLTPFSLNTNDDGASDVFTILVDNSLMTTSARYLLNLKVLAVNFVLSFISIFLNYNFVFFFLKWGHINSLYLVNSFALKRPNFIQKKISNYFHYFGILVNLKVKDIFFLDIYLIIFYVSH